jgi:hypothetical protein
MLVLTTFGHPSNPVLTRIILLQFPSVAYIARSNEILG